MKISIIGIGYVGLVTGVGLAEIGHAVTCVDIDKEKVDKINKGICPIFEKNLEKLLKKNLARRNISATTDLESATLATDITFIAVPTPSEKNNDIDLSFVKNVSKEIGKTLSQKKKYHTIVVKSTVVPETTQNVVLAIIEKYSGKKSGRDFGLCMNPEFLREGNAMEDFMKPDRIVIGQLDKKSGEHLLKVYKPFKADILTTSLSNAEMIKYTNNALLSTLISFSNEIANICQQTPGTDAFEVLKAVHLDKRFNNPHLSAYLWPGCGFGGSCFPKDVKALAAFAKKKKYNPVLLSAVLDINKNQPIKLINLLEKEHQSLEGKKITVLGLAFKPGTDDTRESPAIPIIRELIAKNAEVWAYDPVVNFQNVGPDLKGLKFKFAKSLDQALKNKDACILVTSWNDFKKITPPLLIDGRGFLEPKSFKEKTKYLKIGKKYP